VNASPVHPAVHVGQVEQLVLDAANTLAPDADAISLAAVHRYLDAGGHAVPYLVVLRAATTLGEKNLFRWRTGKGIRTPLPEHVTAPPAAPAIATPEPPAADDDLDALVAVVRLVRPLAADRRQAVLAAASTYFGAAPPAGEP
jgi:hypothetical protein